MEVKIEIDRPMLCYGCLSSDRKLTQVNGLLNTLFFQIRSDGKEASKNDFAVLCWECIAVLRKIKEFQKQTQLAKYRLMVYAPFYYQNTKDDIPASLSNLSTVHTENYHYTYNYDDQQELQMKEQTIIKSPTDVVKEENYSNYTQIKYEELTNNEDYFSNNDADFIDNDSTFNDTKPYIDDIIVKVKKDSKKINKPDSVFYRSIKRYKKYAIVRDSDFDFKSVNVENYNKKVCLDENEYEMYLKCLNYGRVTNGCKVLVNRCKECDKAYLRRVDLMRHKMLNHDTSPFPRNCKSCKAVMNTQDEVTAHWREVHTVMLQCTLCEQVCRNTAEVRKHLNRTHTKIYKCKKCKIDIPTLRQFSMHYRETHQRCVCDDCQRSFLNKKILEKHIIKWHLPAHCNICNRTYKNNHVYTRHCNIYHPKTIDDTKELSYCVECDRQFPSVHTYKKHLADSVKHKPRKKISVPCPECGKTFAKKTYMKNHYALIHMNVTKHCCTICNKYFANGYGVRKHIAVVHQKMQLPKNKMCDLCGRGFSTNRILENHRRTHTGERPYKCPYCSASFAQMTAMKTHQKTQHKNICLMSNLDPGSTMS